MRRQTAALKRKQSGDKGFVFTVRAGLAQEHLYWGVAYSFFILALISSLLPRSVWVGNCQTAAAAAAAASVAALGPLSLSFTLFPPPPLHTLSFLASRSSHSLTPPPKTLLLNNLPPSFSLLRSLPPFSLDLHVFAASCTIPLCWIKINTATAFGYIRSPRRKGVTGNWNMNNQIDPPSSLLLPISCLKSWH